MIFDSPDGWHDGNRRRTRNTRLLVAAIAAGTAISLGMLMGWLWQ